MIKYRVFLMRTKMEKINIDLVREAIEEYRVSKADKFPHLSLQELASYVIQTASRLSLEVKGVEENPGGDLSTKRLVLETKVKATGEANQVYLLHAALGRLARLLTHLDPPDFDVAYAAVLSLYVKERKLANDAESKPEQSKFDRTAFELLRFCRSCFFESQVRKRSERLKLHSNPDSVSLIADADQAKLDNGMNRKGLQISECIGLLKRTLNYFLTKMLPQPEQTII